MLCPSCEFDNPVQARFCGRCGSLLRNSCPKCGSDSPFGFRFCGACGAALDGASRSPVSPALATAEAFPEGERKTVTALFADIKGSTALMRDLDPEEARAIIDPVLQLMMAAVHRYGGYVAQSTGDGIFALFGAPVAHEDHPQRALHAALAMQQELRRYADRLRADGKLPVEARVGVNTGEVVVRTIETGGRTEYTPIGHATNLAARMQTAAPAGAIAASEATRRLCEGYFEFRALGPTAIKGLDAPVEVFEVVRPGPLRTHFQLSARRGLTDFVGREGEIAAMTGALAQATAGHGRIVAAVGEAGAGKSRLMYEFRATIPGGVKVLEAHSVSHDKASAWLPVLTLLYDYFGIEVIDDKTQRRGKIELRLNTLDPALKDAQPLIYTLMGLNEDAEPFVQMDAQIKRQRMLDAIKRIVLRESLNQPLVIIFEDLHWIDNATQALLDVLINSIGNARVLLLVNYRPEYRHDWANKSYYSQFRLEALGPESAREMLSALLGDEGELEPLKRMVIERAEGNPFFIEEIVQALFDEGALVRNGTVKVMRSLSDLRLPPTVQGMLAARIDRLSAEQKDLLQTLAVIGRKSSLGLVRQVALPTDLQLERMLADLQAGEFIYEQPARAGAEYIFKHALTQEVAYNSLLVERRKLLHERVGQVLESMFGDRLDDHLGELARHYSRCDNVAKAVDYLERAGRQAIRRSSYSEAINDLTAAIDLLQKLPDSPERARRELLLQLAVSPAFIALKGYAAAETEQAYTRARQLCGAGNPPELFAALLGLWAVDALRGEYRKAYELAEQLLRQALSTQESTLLLYARYAMGVTLYGRGEFLRAREHFELTVSLYDSGRPLAFGACDAGVAARSLNAWTLWQLGYPDQALAGINKALSLAQTLSHPFSLAFATIFGGVLHQSRREAAATQASAERGIALSTEHGFTEFLAYGITLRGWAIAEQGRHDEGIAQIHEGLAAGRATGTELHWTYFMCLLAAAYMKTSRLEDGSRAFAQALAVAEKNEARAFEAEMHRLRGELVLRRQAELGGPAQMNPRANPAIVDSSTAEAQGWFQRAIEIARNQNAKSWELRATTSLARLLARQGRREEAQNRLAEIYGWFTEGFDTADLKDAKALLDDLGVD